MSQRTTKATGDVVKRLSLIRALTLAVQTDPDLENIEQCGIEYFHAILDCLEGKTLQQLDLKKINPERVERYLREG